MNLRAKTRLFHFAICLVLVVVALAEPCFGQTDQAPTSPRSTPPPPPTGDANVGTSRAGNLGDTSATIDGSTRTNPDKGRKLEEEMIVIDAATRQKQREREMAQHDRTFDSSILDVGVDVVVIGKTNAKPEARPSAKPIASASPAPKSSVTPAPISSSSADVGAGTSLNLEVVPIASSSQPSPSPSASASPHN